MVTEAQIIKALEIVTQERGMTTEEVLSIVQSAMDKVIGEDVPPSAMKIRQRYPTALEFLTAYVNAKTMEQAKHE